MENKGNRLANLAKKKNNNGHQTVWKENNQMRGKKWQKGQHKIGRNTFFCYLHRTLN